MNDMTFRPGLAAPALTAKQEGRLQAVQDQLDRLNATIREAVHAGLSVELQRSARHHCGGGCWGDQMRPIVVLCR